MKRSAEIEQLGRDLVEALNRGDIEFLKRKTSREPGTILIGTDPDELVRGYDQIIELFRASTPEGSLQVSSRVGEIHGYEDGDFAWADGTGAFVRDGDTVDVRLTFVLLRESGEWRMVQNHASIGVPNDQMFTPLFRRTGAAAH